MVARELDPGAIDAGLASIAVGSGLTAKDLMPILFEMHEYDRKMSAAYDAEKGSDNG